MGFDALLQRKIMGRFVTGVALVTSVDEDVPCGMTANSLTSLSLNPPLILLAVNRENQMYKALSLSQRFSISLLSVGQEHVARRFASNGPKDFSDLSVDVGITGCPVLQDSLGYIHCSVVEVFPGGDHSIFVGECVAGEVSEGEPLVYYSGAFTQLRPSVSAGGAHENQFFLEDSYEYYGSI